VGDAGVASTAQKRRQDEDLLNKEAVRLPTQIRPTADGFPGWLRCVRRSEPASVEKT
jgi:hypothetical protein